MKWNSEDLSNNEDIDKEYPYELVIGREDDFENIDEIVWYLMDLAELLSQMFDYYRYVVMKV